MEIIYYGFFFDGFPYHINIISRGSTLALDSLCGKCPPSPQSDAGGGEHWPSNEAIISLIELVTLGAAAVGRR